MTPVDFILSQPWAMLPENVEQIISIAERSDVDLEAVAAKLGRPLENTRTVSVREGGVAVIPICGPISRYMNLFQAISGGTSVSVLARDIRTALDDPKVNSIILEIDSPGGQAAGIGELAAQIREGTKSKPIVSYVSNLGASAGYWLASAGSEVVAAPSAILGSVGVVWPMSRTTDDGKTIEFVSSQSPNKRLSTETKDGREKMQGLVDQMARVFIADVAANREITAEKVVSDFRAGGLLVGQEAVDAGMADRLGSLEGLIAELAVHGKTKHGKPGDHAVNVKPKPGVVAGAQKSESMMTFKEIVASWFAKGMPDEFEVSSEEAASDRETRAKEINARFGLDKPAEPTAREKELEAKLKAYEAAQNAATNACAESWFAAQVKAERLTPADKDKYVALYVEFAKADDASPLVFHAENGASIPCPRLGSFTAAIEAKPKNGLTTEMIPVDAAKMGEHLSKNGLAIMDNAAATPADAKAEAESKARKEAMLAAINAD